jgi:hypothetical protein
MLQSQCRQGPDSKRKSQPVNNHEEFSVSTLATALALGLVADLLLRATPWGLNVGLWVALLGLAAWTLRRRAQAPPITTSAMLAFTTVLFAAGFAWRDTPVLRGLDGIGLGLSAALLLWRVQGGLPWRAGLLQHGRKVIEALGQTALGMPYLIARDIEWGTLPRVAMLRRAPSVMVGIVLSIPLLLLFGGLLVSADAAFRRIAVNLVDIDLAAWLPHLAVTAGGAWVAGGYLRALLIRPDSPQPPLINSQRPARVGTIELCLPLAVLDLLFLSFIVVQLRYLFGGAGLVEVVPGLTYAEYARQGFFQLVAVAFLTLPLLLVIDWLLDNGQGKRPFRKLASLAIILLFVIMVSALQRMRLYQLEFGLTELRFHTTAFMFWLCAVFLWFSFTVLRGHRERFPVGALLAGVVAIAILHAVNPDRWIVQTNVARAIEGKPLDVDYLLSLSADAVPALVSALPSLPPEPGAALRYQLAERANNLAPTDWRSLNWSRMRATSALAKLPETR